MPALIAVALIAVLAAAPAGALSLAPMSLAEAVDDAERIVHGTVTDVRAGRDERGLPATWVTVRVARTLKGARAAELRFKQFGAVAGPDGRLPMPFLPRYRSGSEIVLLLRRPSRHGFTSPVHPSLGVHVVAGAGAGGAGAAAGALDAAARDRLLEALATLIGAAE